MPVTWFGSGPNPRRRTCRDETDHLPEAGRFYAAATRVFWHFGKIGSYGGVITGLSPGMESGTSDLLSVRQVNFVRYVGDLQTVVPNVAKTMVGNDD